MSRDKAVTPQPARANASTAKAARKPARTHRGRVRRPGAGQFHKRNGRRRGCPGRPMPQSRPCPENGKRPTRGRGPYRCCRAREARSGRRRARRRILDLVVFVPARRQCRLSHGGQPLIQVAKPMLACSEESITIIADRAPVDHARPRPDRFEIADRTGELNAAPVRSPSVRAIDQIDTSTVRGHSAQTTRHHAQLDDRRSSPKLLGDPIGRTLLLDQ